jgi:hypothetical protein
MKLFKRKMSKKMKAALNALADGIECGAKLRPQVFGGLWKSKYVQQSATLTYGTCALGAAVECALRREGVSEDEIPQRVAGSTDYSQILALYGLKDRSADCDLRVRNQDEDYLVIDNGENDTIATLIYRLNDQLEWTREQIAAFLRDLE